MSGRTARTGCLRNLLWCWHKCSLAKYDFVDLCVDQRSYIFRLDARVDVLMCELNDQAVDVFCFSRVDDFLPVVEVFR
jgi:hypothetical protein